jgi:hypothetical protein
MNQPSEPTFEPRPLKIGGDWSVVATWRDGHTERITGFKSGREAFDWVENQSQGWLAKRAATKSAGET